MSNSYSITVQIVYEDGDSEDMTHDEVNATLVPPEKAGTIDPETLQTLTALAVEFDENDPGRCFQGVVEVAPGEEEDEDEEEKERGPSAQENTVATNVTVSTTLSTAGSVVESPVDGCDVKEQPMEEEQEGEGGAVKEELARTARSPFPSLTAFTTSNSCPEASSHDILILSSSTHEARHNDCEDKRSVATHLHLSAQTDSGEPLIASPESDIVSVHDQQVSPREVVDLTQDTSGSDSDNGTTVPTTKKKKEESSRISDKVTNEKKTSGSDSGSSSSGSDSGSSSSGSSVTKKKTSGSNSSSSESESDRNNKSSSGGGVTKKRSICHHSPSSSSGSSSGSGSGDDDDDSSSSSSSSSDGD